MTHERRFEVDGAVAALAFLEAQQGEQDEHSTHSNDYYKHKLRQLIVWDAIALHTTPSIAHHTVPEVGYCQRGTGFDILGLWMDHVPDAAATVEAVLEAYPRLEIKGEFTGCLCAIARSKPETTFDNFVAAFGETYVEGYTRSREVETMIIAALRP